MISIRFSSEEEEYIKKFAEIKGVTVSQLIKDAILDKMEDELGLTIEEEEAVEDYIKNGGKTRPLSDFWKEQGLE